VFIVDLSNRGGAMAILKGKQVYLGGPIEFEDRDKPDWRPEVIKELESRFDLVVYDPSQDEKQSFQKDILSALAVENYDEAERIASDFVTKDLGTIDRSDILIAYVPRGVPSTGTPVEIHHAISVKKPTLLVCPQGKRFTALWWFGEMRHQFCFGSWNDLYDYLTEVNSGHHRHDKKWRYIGLFADT